MSVPEATARREPPAAGPGPAALPDEEVVARVRAGEGALFELLMRRHNQRVFRAARAVLRDDGEAEDVVQDAFVRAYRALDGFEGRAAFATWLTRIAVNEALARRRARIRTRPALEPAMSLPASTPDPERDAGDAELGRLLTAAVDGLPESLRVVFVLRDVEGLDTAETASCLDLSQAAVKVRLHRARHALRVELDRRLGAETRALFGFGAARCDRAVAAVLARLGIAGAAPASAGVPSGQGGDPG